MHTIHIGKLYILPGGAIESGRRRCSFVSALRLSFQTFQNNSFQSTWQVHYGLFLVQVRLGKSIKWVSEDWSNHKGTTFRGVQKRAKIDQGRMDLKFIICMVSITLFCLYCQLAIELIHMTKKYMIRMNSSVY